MFLQVRLRREDFRWFSVSLRWAINYIDVMSVQPIVYALYRYLKGQHDTSRSSFDELWRHLNRTNSISHYYSEYLQ